MKANFKSVIFGCVIGSVITSGVTAFAYNGTRSINATFKNIRIFVDGAELTPQDSSGNILEPFIYNGSTYLPIRAVGEAVGKDVSYDPNNNIVYLGNGFNSNNGYVSGTKLDPYNKKNVYVNDITMSGVTYKDGIEFSGWMGSYQDGTANYNLGGKYTTISGMYGTLDGRSTSTGGEATMSFYGDGILLQSYTIKSGQVAKSFSINVTGVSQLDIVTEQTPEGGMSPVGVGDLYAK